MKKFNIATCIDCTKKEYTDLEKHYNNTLYCCYDTGELFKGNTKLGSDDKPEPQILDVELTRDGEGFVSESTYQDVLDAKAAGKVIQFICTEGNSFNQFHLCQLLVDETVTIRFVGLMDDGGLANFENPEGVTDVNSTIEIAAV